MHGWDPALGKLPAPVGGPATDEIPCAHPAVIGPAESCQQLLRVGGMTCSSCSSAVEAALRGVPGVQEASVNLLAGTAEVRRWPGRQPCCLPCAGVEHAGQYRCCAATAASGASFSAPAV